jgi:abequosyltransferase
MKKNYKLCICIPTLNRSGFVINELSEWSKIPGVNEVEIVVIDDASDDDTADRVNDFIRRNKKLNMVFIKNKKRLGFDKMLLDIIKHASGKYCWLISDDDLPKSNSLEKILKVIDNHKDLALIHLNYSRFDNILKKVTASYVVGEFKKDIHFSDKNDFVFKEIPDSYFQYLGTNVITMSSDVVNRKEWLEAAKSKKRFIGHNFMHSFIIADMVSRNQNVYFIAKPMLQYLSNNHRVWPNNIWKDYNSVYLNYLIELGYDKKRVLKMRRDQKKYEQQEGITKHPIFKYIYNLARPFYARLQYIKSKLVI